MTKSANDESVSGGRHRGRKFRAKRLKTALPRPEPDSTLQPVKGAERIAKVMARAGLCSRREAETWIAAGRVAVNGVVITSPALNITASDRVTVDRGALPARERTRLFLYHKPRGLLTTSADPQGRPTVFGALPKHLPRLVSVGRLDLNTEGLLLLTNDGGLARALELPATAWLRRYRVRAHGRITQAELDRLRNGIAVKGIQYGAIEAALETHAQKGANVWLTFAMREGKNREVKNVLDALGLQVNRLIRVSYGPFQLGDLQPGTVMEVSTRHLRDQIGERLAAISGADFSAPIAAQPEQGETHKHSIQPEVPATRHRASKRDGSNVRPRPSKAASRPPQDDGGRRRPNSGRRPR